MPVDLSPQLLSHSPALAWTLRIQWGLSCRWSHFLCVSEYSLALQTGLEMNTSAVRGKLQRVKTPDTGVFQTSPMLLPQS